MYRNATFSDKKDRIRVSYRLNDGHLGPVIQRVVYLTGDLNAFTCWRDKRLIEQVRRFTNETSALQSWNLLLRQEGNRLRRLGR